MIGKKVSVADIKIKEVGIFDIETLYKEAKSWFDSKNYTFQEKEHTEKIRDIGDEYLIQWVAERKVDGYVKFNIETSFFIRYITKIKIREKQLYKGDMEITTKAFLELDYKNNWHTSAIKKFLFNIYSNYIIKEKINDYNSKLDNEVKELLDIIKSVINIHI